jgi:hypothetical protein
MPSTRGTQPVDRVFDGLETWPIVRPRKGALRRVAQTNAAARNFVASGWLLVVARDTRKTHRHATHGLASITRGPDARPDAQSSPELTHACVPGEAALPHRALRLQIGRRNSVVEQVALHAAPLLSGFLEELV